MADQPPGAGQTSLVGFEADVKPLFRQKDRDAMLPKFDLWLYDDVRQHVDAIGAALEHQKMPCDGPWPPEQVAIFESWQRGGCAP
jgi:hypothetical protein